MTQESAVSPEGFRSLDLADMIAMLETVGEPVDPRTGIDTESLRTRFPRLGEVAMTDLEVPGSREGLAARSYVDPTASPSGSALVWVHGGAFLGGHLDMPEANWVAMELASAGVPVLSIDYTKCIRGVHYPVPSDDVLSVWRFASANSLDLLGVAPDRLHVGGASAGATLTAGAVRRLADSDEPVPAGLLLVYPALHPDSTDPDALVDASSAPAIAFNYAGTPEALGDPAAFPGLGTGDGYPPALIVACELDGFLPSATHFADTLRSAGVDVALRVEIGADHGHIDEPADETAIRTITAMSEWLHRESAGRSGTTASG
ncbi:Lipase 2 [Microbacterium hydrocarbonoxydans]|uniref:Lipase 2 n=1 Tax=Microbacterium hydrocarbonoxydans TaxID=273678 RepID=A0A0M2HKR6_9MICO|nr:alpha/beta hydrolase fold domain-containing protein [Microbacterium hydrocarbonoxydans]KJL47332.1 Lipase 2 [Microbacterium hydrocarbonoxydans]